MLLFILHSFHGVEQKQSMSNQMPIKPKLPEFGFDYARSLQEGIEKIAKSIGETGQG